MKNRIKKKILNALLKSNDISYFTIRNTLTEYNIITHSDFIEMYDFVKFAYRRLKVELNFAKERYKMYGEPYGPIDDFDDNEVYKMICIGGYMVFYKRNYTERLNTLETILDYFNNILGEEYYVQFQ